jgi:hypothetical protein
MWRDVRFACRVLVRRPLFTLLAALSLGLGIGANSAIFSLIDTSWFRPLAVPRAGDIARVFSASLAKATNAAKHGTTTCATGTERDSGRSSPSPVAKQVGFLGFCSRLGFRATPWNSAPVQWTDGAGFSALWSASLARL